MDRNIFGIFLAGGSGSRMGADLPKQFLLLGGKPILQRTIESFCEAVPGMTVITVLPKRHFSTWKELCLRYSCDVPQILVPGGITRFHSVRAALARVPDGAVAMIHDGVRPFAGPELVRRALEAIGRARAVIPVVPVVDALRSTDPAVPDPDRTRTVAVQTPQVFLSEDIKAAYRQPYDISFPDDGAVAARAGIPLTFIEGERLNVKITSRPDLELAEAILGLRK